MEGWLWFRNLCLTAMQKQDVCQDELSPIITDIGVWGVVGPGWLAGCVLTGSPLCDFTVSRHSLYIILLPPAGSNSYTQL